MEQIVLPPDVRRLTGFNTARKSLQIKNMRRVQNNCQALYDLLTRHNVRIPHNVQTKYNVARSTFNQLNDPERPPRYALMFDTRTMLLQMLNDENIRRMIQPIPVVQVQQNQNQQNQNPLPFKDIIDSFAIQRTERQNSYADNQVMGDAICTQCQYNFRVCTKMPVRVICGNNGHFQCAECIANTHEYLTNPIGDTGHFYFNSAAFKCHLCKCRIQQLELVPVDQLVQVQPPVQDGELQKKIDNVIKKIIVERLDSLVTESIIRLGNLDEI